MEPNHQLYTVVHSCPSKRCRRGSLLRMYVSAHDQFSRYPSKQHKPRTFLPENLYPYIKCFRNVHGLFIYCSCNGTIYYRCLQYYFVYCVYMRLLLVGTLHTSSYCVFIEKTRPCAVAYCKRCFSQFQGTCKCFLWLL